MPSNLATLKRTMFFAATRTISLSRSVMANFADGVGRHRGMLDVDFTVDREEGSRPAVEAVMFFQRRVEFVGVALHHGFIDQRADAGFRGRADEHAADDRSGVGDAFDRS